MGKWPSYEHLRFYAGAAEPPKTWGEGLTLSSLSSADFSIFPYTKGYVNDKSGCGTSKELWYTISLTTHIKILFFRGPRNDIALLSSALKIVSLYIFWCIKSFLLDLIDLISIYNDGFPFYWWFPDIHSQKSSSI